MRAPLPTRRPDSPRMNQIGGKPDLQFPQGYLLNVISSTLTLAQGSIGVRNDP
jgi:hypothetical protein